MLKILSLNYKFQKYLLLNFFFNHIFYSKNMDKSKKLDEK